MVLDNATTPGDSAADSFTFEEDRSDAFEPLDQDHIRINNPPGTLTIDTRRVSDWLKPSERWRSTYMSAIQARCDYALGIMGRPLHQEEAEALAGNTLHAFGLQIFCSAAMQSVMGGWAVIRVALNVTNYRKSEEGQRTKTRWPFRPIMRPITLLGVGLVVGQIFVMSYARTVNLVRDMRDPRLGDFRKAMAEIAAKNGRRPIEASGTTQPETFEQRRQRESMQGMIRRSRAQPQTSAPLDDASPTGGALMQEWTDFAPDRPESQPPAQPTRVQPRPSSTALDRGQTGSDYDPFNQDTPSSSSATASTSSSGSAWDRIRNEASQSKPRR